LAPTARAPTTLARLARLASAAAATAAAATATTALTGRSAPAALVELGGAGARVTAGWCRRGGRRRGWRRALAL